MLLHDFMKSSYIILKSLLLFLFKAHRHAPQNLFLKSPCPGNHQQSSTCWFLISFVLFFYFGLHDVVAWLYEILLYDVDVFIIISCLRHIDTHGKISVLKSRVLGIINSHQHVDFGFPSFLFLYFGWHELVALLYEILLYDFDVFIIISFKAHRHARQNLFLKSRVLGIHLLLRPTKNK